MKKYFFLLSSFFLAGGWIFAQEGVKVGFRAGPIVSWANIVDNETKMQDPYLDIISNVGFSFDFVFTYGLNELIGFRSGINIVQKGYSTDVLNIEKTNIRVTALEVPIGFKFRSTKIGSGMHIVGHLGLNPEFNLANKRSYSLNHNATVLEFEENNIPYNKITGSFVPGIGLDWELDWGMLELAATYHLGLISLTPPEEWKEITKMNYIALNLGYFF